MFTIIDRTDPDRPSLTPREIAAKIASERTGRLTIDHLVRAVEYERAQTESLHMNQRETLEYLGIEFEDGTADEGTPAWYLPAQTIERED